MSSLSQEDKELLNQLNSRPALKKRIKSILSTACDDGEEIVKADEAEKRVTEEVRQLGNDALTGCSRHGYKFVGRSAHICIEMESGFFRVSFVDFTGKFRAHVLRQNSSCRLYQQYLLTPGTEMKGRSL
jgi:hypothetical protein